mgnify:CR=1 FL=1
MSSEALYSYDPSLFQTFDCIKEFTFLFALKLEMLKHLSDGGARPSESVHLLPEIGDDQAFHASALPCGVSN